MAIVAVVASLGAASAATVVNGSFEEAPSVVGKRGNSFADMMNVASGKQSWDIWQTLPGWTTASGAGIEVQTNGTLKKIDAQDGSYYVELDSKNNSSMEQQVTLSAGTYDLSFYYAPRDKDANSNGIDFSIGSLAGNVAGPNAEFPRFEWTEVTRRFSVATDGSYTLSFAASGASNSLGGLIDNVSISEVPLPASAALLLGGLAGFGALRRKKA